MITQQLDNRGLRLRGRVRSRAGERGKVHVRDVT